MAATKKSILSSPQSASSLSAATLIPETSYEAALLAGSMSDTAIVTTSKAYPP